ncbi:MAG: prkC 3, partial [Mucilaginibacter sp.]|nr:prkC 3 [Mucilaginibacter sp.]
SMRHAGAIEFMAPEQNTGTMLFQTDIYSYGIIIYELLAGQVPFPLQDSGETSRNTVMIAHMESPVPNLLALRKKNLPESWAEDKKEREMHIPLWLLNLVDKCLEKVPENRYSNGMELQEAIIDGTINTIKTDVVADNLNTNVIINQGVNGVAQPGTLRKENNGLIRISKPAFWGLMILLAGFMASTGYFLFFTHRNIKREIKSSAVPAADSSARMEATRKMERKKATDSATLKAIREEILKQRKNDIGSPNEADSNSTAPDTIANPSPN